MKIRSVAGYASLFIVAYRLFKKITEAEVRVRTMVIEKKFLEMLYNQMNFQEFIFNHEYDNRVLARDRLLLVGNISHSDRSNTRIELRSIDKGKRFTNELDYSVYRLDKDDIEKILKFGSDPAVVNFLLEPELYRADPRYLAYQVIPADQFNRPIHLHRSAIKMEFVMATESEFVNTEKAASADVTSREEELIINPSPPATISLSEE